MKKLIIIAASVLAITACSEGGQPTRGLSSWLSNDTFQVHQVELIDGRTIQCIGFQSGYQAGLSCDWD